MILRTTVRFEHFNFSATSDTFRNSTSVCFFIAFPCCCVAIVTACDAGKDTGDFSPREKVGSLCNRLWKTQYNKVTCYVLTGIQKKRHPALLSTVGQIVAQSMSSLVLTCASGFRGAVKTRPIVRFAKRILPQYALGAGSRTFKSCRPDSVLPMKKADSARDRPFFVCRCGANAAQNT